MAREVAGLPRSSLTTSPTPNSNRSAAKPRFVHGLELPPVLLQPPPALPPEQRHAQALLAVQRRHPVPHEKLRSIAGAERFLKPGVDFETLDAQAHAESDLAAARRVKEERDRLFAAIGRAWPAVA